jgi:hypothetical protein
MVVGVPFPSMNINMAAKLVGILAVGPALGMSRAGIGSASSSDVDLPLARFIPYLFDMTWLANWKWNGKESERKQ